MDIYLFVYTQLIEKNLKGKENKTKEIYNIRIYFELTKIFQ